MNFLQGTKNRFQRKNPSFFFYTVLSIILLQKCGVFFVIFEEEKKLSIYDLPTSEMGTYKV